MRICHLSKNQLLTPSYAFKNPTIYPTLQQFFLQLNPQAYRSAVKGSRNLKSRHILLGTNSLPFQATAKLFHEPPKKTLSKESRKQT